MGDDGHRLRWGRVCGVLVWVAVGVAGVVFLLDLRTVAAAVGAPGPLEYREPNMVLVTRLMLRGVNPYSLPTQPAYADLYGIAYPVAVYPLARVWGATYLVLRGVAVVCVLGCAGVVGWAVRGYGVRWGLVWVGAVYVLADLSTRYVPLSVMARPDSLGMLCFLLAVVVPWRWRFNAWSLGACVGLSVVGALAKPYFALGLPVVVSYLVLFEDLGRGVVLAGVGTVVGVGVVVGVDAVLPWYVHDIYYVQRGLIERSLGHLLWQYGYWATSVPGLLALVVVAGGMGVRGWRRGGGEIGRSRIPQGPSPQPSPGAPGEGEMRGAGGTEIAAGRDARSGSRRRGILRWHVSVPAWGLVVGLVVFTFVMGSHKGNGMTYLYHLVGPWAVVVGLGVVERGLARGGWAGVLAVGAVVVDMGLTVAVTPAPPGGHADVWAAWEGVVARGGTRIYVPGALSEIAERHGAEVWDAGFADTFPLGIRTEPRWRGEVAAARMREVNAAVDAGVAKREFGLIVIPVGQGQRFPVLFDPALLRGQYTRLAVVPMPMDWEGSFDWRGEVWVPIEGRGLP